LRYIVSGDPDLFRQDSVHFWGQVIHDVFTRFAGISQQDFSKTFNVMMEAVEVTALQRGCLRWEP
jgi:hypothetical protein